MFSRLTQKRKSQKRQPRKFLYFLVLCLVLLICGTSEIQAQPSFLYRIEIPPKVQAGKFIKIRLARQKKSPEQRLGEKVLRGMLYDASLNPLLPAPIAPGNSTVKIKFNAAGREIIFWIDEGILLAVSKPIEVESTSPAAARIIPPPAVATGHPYPVRIELKDPSGNPFHGNASKEFPFSLRIRPPKNAASIQIPLENKSFSAGVFLQLMPSFKSPGKARIELLDHSQRSWATTEISVVSSESLWFKKMREEIDKSLAHKQYNEAKWYVHEFLKLYPTGNKEILSLQRRVDILEKVFGKKNSESQKEKKRPRSFIEEMKDKYIEGEKDIKRSRFRQSLLNRFVAGSPESNRRLLLEAKRIAGDDEMVKALEKHLESEMK